MNKENKLDFQRMRTEVSKLKANLKQMEASWALETHTKKKDILWNQIEETERKINTINRDLSLREDSILNLTDFLKYAIDLVYNPLEMWNKVELGDKQRFQNLLFPQGILFNKENRYIEPLKVNQFFIVNPNNPMDCEKIKMDFSAENAEKSKLVPEAGLEPAQP